MKNEKLKTFSWKNIKKRKRDEDDANNASSDVLIIIISLLWIVLAHTISLPLPSLP